MNTQKPTPLEYKNNTAQKNNMNSHLKRGLVILGVAALAFFLGYFVRGYGKTQLPPNSNAVPFQSAFQQFEEKTDKDFNFKMFEKVWSYVQENYVDPEKVEGKKLFYGSLEGIVQAVDDPYTVFLEPSVSREFQQEISGKFEGIGAEIGLRNKLLTIIAPLSGSPAEKAGLKGGDIILNIDGKETKNVGLEEAVKSIRGKRGTKVTLTVWREKENMKKDVEIVRDEVPIVSVEWNIVDGIAHVKLKYFNEDTLVKFNNAINEIILKNPKGIVLDLRNNPGGLLQTAIEVSSYWIGADEIIVIEKRRDGRFTSETAFNRKALLKDIPTVVLVNQGSASGSEIVAGALQDYKFASLVGVKTFGKGSVQDLLRLEDGSSVKLTIAQWLTPKGREINGAGIDPDIVVDLTEEDWDKNKDPQLEKAFEILKK